LNSREWFLSAQPGSIKESEALTAIVLSFCKILHSAPQKSQVFTNAYERTRQELGPVGRNDPLTETFDKKVIELGQRGERGAGQLSELAINELGLN
jgi:hypothetical protein